MEIAFFRQEQLESVVDLLHEMSLHYNRDNASSRDVVKANLIGLDYISRRRVVPVVVQAHLVQEINHRLQLFLPKERDLHVRLRRLAFDMSVADGPIEA